MDTRKHERRAKLKRHAADAIILPSIAILAFIAIMLALFGTINARP